MKKSKEFIEFKILSFLENNSSFDNFVYSNYEHDLIIDTIYELSNKGLIEFYLFKEKHSQPNVNICNYQKRLTIKGKEYLNYLKNIYN